MMRGTCPIRAQAMRSVESAQMLRSQGTTILGAEGDRFAPVPYDQNTINQIPTRIVVADVSPCRERSDPFGGVALCVLHSTGDHMTTAGSPWQALSLTTRNPALGVS